MKLKRTLSCLLSLSVSYFTPKCQILAIQNPKIRYNLKHCTLPLLHGMNDQSCFSDWVVLSMRRPRGGGGLGVRILPWKLTKIMVSLGILVWTPWKVTKLSIQHLVSGHHRIASETPFKWRFAGGSMVARLISGYRFSKNSGTDHLFPTRLMSGLKYVFYN